MSRISPRRPAFSMVGILVVLGLIALLLAFLFPAVTKVRSAAGRTQDMNNQRQLGIACHSFHDVYRMFPFNGDKGSFANPMNRDSGSWLYQTLPFIEQNAAFKNPKGAERLRIPVLMSPGRMRTGFVTEGKFLGPQSDYALNTWINDPAKGAPDAPSSKAKITNILDGSSNTILLGQLSLRTTDYMKTDGSEGFETIFLGGTLGTGRNQPRHVNDGPDIDFAGKFGGPYPGVTLFGMADGSVRTISTSFDLRPALTPSGGEAFNID